MIPLMYLSSNDNLSSGTGVIPPGNVPKTCVSNCTTPLPVIKDSLGNPVNIGDFWTEQGGYYSGLFTLTGNEIYALIISPASFGKIDNVNIFASSISSSPLVAYLSSSIDGKKNTDDAINWAYANNQQNNYPLIKAVKEKRDLNYNGYNDYYIPSRQETILMHKYFKPNNLCSTTDSRGCTGQAVNTTNLYPCNICDLSTINSITVFNSFKETQSESFKTYLNSSTSIYYFFFTSTRYDTYNTSNLTAYYYKGSYDGYTNFIGISYYSYHTTTTRLVRRVLVS